jgi:protoporphyrinogen oxidase
MVINHNSSPALRATARHGVAAEVSLAAGHLPLDLEARIVRSLLHMRIIRSAGEVYAARVVTLARAYPVPSHACAAFVPRLREWLAQQRIHSVGRFGEWAYINSDEALQRGLALGARLLAA